MPSAFISGISGQDGSLLARHLFELGYQISGSSRTPKDTSKLFRLSTLGILDQVTIVDSKVSKSHLLDQFQPDELYNLEGQSSVASSFKTPHETIASNGLSTLDWLEAIRLHDQKIKFYQASSAEIFGSSKHFSRGEASPIHPQSPYGVSKLFSHYITINYRESYDLFACCGILFNHESPLRGQQFVTQKIATAAAKWKKSPGQVLRMGNIHVQRDWGHAKDFVRGMHCILQQEQADDFVLATGVLHSVKDFISAAYQSIGVELVWSGEGIEEQAHSAEGQLCVSIDPKYYRPSDIQRSLGNPIKARNVLNWQPEHSFEQIVQEMVESHL